MWQN